MIKNVKTVTIVGAGSAGWMTAALLVKFFPSYDISVIESPDVPTVGVGESTLLGIRNYCNYLEIDERDFMEHTDASYKLSIKFTDFHEKGSGGFHYPFGEPCYEGTKHGLEDWFYKKAVYPDIPNNDFAKTYFPNAALYEQNKFSLNKQGIYGKFDPSRHVSFHFDATKFGIWLRDRYCIPRGVKVIKSTVADIKVSDKGIDKLILKEGNEITSDLFVDCTGWRSLLLGGALGEEFISYNDMLPNNRAWATRLPYKDKEAELEGYTNCTALGNGWVWNIPVWSRLGTGYVYSDKFTSPEDAKEEFKQHLMSNNMVCPRTREEVDALEFKDIPMRVGIHRRTFVKNVVAIGLSAGFIEPLESNGLFSVHEFLDKLVKTLLAGNVTQFDRDVYSTATRAIFQNFAEFVAMHYSFSKRDDTPYWQANNDRELDPTMADLDPTVSIGFFQYQDLKMFKANLEPEKGLIWIATGMNRHLIDKVNIRNIEFVNKISMKDYMAGSFTRVEQKKHRWWKAAENEQTLYQYLKTNIHKED